MERQKATYLDVMKALLDKGADANGRIRSHPWYMVYTGCGNRNCGLADTSGSTAFWRAAYSVDLDAMKLLVSYGADPNIATMAPAAPIRRGGGECAPGSGRPRCPDARRRPGALHGATDSARRSRCVPRPRGSRCGIRRGLRGQRPPPCAGRLDAGHQVPGRGTGRRRQRPRQRRLHTAAPRGRTWRQPDDPLPGVEGRRRHAPWRAAARPPRTWPTARCSACRPFPETVALLEKLGSRNNHKCASC